ncbi:unnamed protein product [Trichobilharzia regenti]|nr:unnamed protein product [Trichobilharzia regenti]
MFVVSGWESMDLSFILHTQTCTTQGSLLFKRKRSLIAKYSLRDSLLAKIHGNRGGGGTVWLRAKLFQFVENYRPAYYGTWRRRSRIVTGRRPFARDDYQLDYSIDSDDEWEEEEPGESITQSDVS